MITVRSISIGVLFDSGQHNNTIIVKNLSLTIKVIVNFYLFSIKKALVKFKILAKILFPEIQFQSFTEY